MKALDSARKELRSQGRPSSRGGSGFLKSSSSNPLSELGFNVTNPQSTSGEGEWLVLAAYEKMQYENEQKVYRKKILADRQATKKFLDVQFNQTQKNLEAEKEETLKYAQQQDEELRQWKIKEARKEEQIKRKMYEEKVSRDAQIQMKKKYQEKERQKKQDEDWAEIERCRRAIQAEKEQMRLFKMREQEKLQAILIENAKNDVEAKKKMEAVAAEDVELMRQYSAKLAKQDADREAQLKKTLHTLESNTEAATLIKQKELDAEARLAANIEKHKLAKDAADAAREKYDKDKRANDVVACKLTLREQLRAQKQAEDQQREEDKRFAERFARENEAANRAEQEKQDRIRRKNKEHQQQLREQIDFRRSGQSAPFNSLDKSVELGGMSFSEKRMNRQLLSRIIQDRDSKSEIERMLNQSNNLSSGFNQTQLSNVF